MEDFSYFSQAALSSLRLTETLNLEILLFYNKFFPDPHNDIASPVYLIWRKEMR